MRAWLLDRHGKGRALCLSDLPDPLPGRHDVLIRIHAAGLNPLDLKLRYGAFKVILPRDLPLIPRHDLAGEVVAVGPQVMGCHPGDRVMARVRDGRIGCLAELSAVDAGDQAAPPRGLIMGGAAGQPVTAWQVLAELGQIGPVAKVLIPAGTGGVGMMAIQLAKHLGAHVATTARVKNADMLRDPGADQVIDCHSQDFAAGRGGRPASCS